LRFAGKAAEWPLLQGGIKIMTVAATAAAGERVVRPQFTASASEYFRIWIVNLFFTLVSLGIYSAWAKVRKRRYFYGSTRVDGATFDYFASPKAVLKGRIVAVIVLGAYALLGELLPQSRFVFWGAAIVMLPWLGVRALQFNARNSGWRGLRFDFAASTWKAARTYAAMLALWVFTLGLATPWFVARMKSFIIANHAFGTTAFACELRGRDFLKIYFLAGLLITAFAVPLTFAAGMVIAFVKLPEEYASAIFLLPAIPIYASYIVGYAYSEARTANLVWNNTRAPGLRFSSSLSAVKLARLYLGNVLAVLFSAGLLIPWAVVRTRRYRLECIEIAVAQDAVHEANAELPRVGATGQEMGDLFNLDLGI
jgi:uncharacterized membrane protein YjgN (DUF898 family)